MILSLRLLFPRPWGAGCCPRGALWLLQWLLGGGGGCGVPCVLFRWGSFSQFLETCPASPWLPRPGKAPTEPRVAAKRQGCVWRGVGAPSVGVYWGRQCGSGIRTDGTGPPGLGGEVCVLVCVTQFPHIYGAFVEFSGVLLL